MVVRYVCMGGILLCFLFFVVFLWEFCELLNCSFMYFECCMWLVILFYLIMLSVYYKLFFKFVLRCFNGGRLLYIVIGVGIF